MSEGSPIIGISGGKRRAVAQTRCECECDGDRGCERDNDVRLPDAPRTQTVRSVLDATGLPRALRRQQFQDSGRGLEL